MKIFEIFDLKFFGRPISKYSIFFRNKPFWSRFFSKLCRFSWRTSWNRSPSRAMLLDASKTFWSPLKFLVPSRYATDISGYRIDPPYHIRMRNLFHSSFPWKLVPPRDRNRKKDDRANLKSAKRYLIGKTTL